MAPRGGGKPAGFSSSKFTSHPATFTVQATDCNPPTLWKKAEHDDRRGSIHRQQKSPRSQCCGADDLLRAGLPSRHCSPFHLADADNATTRSTRSRVAYLPRAGTREGALGLKRVCHRPCYEKKRRRRRRDLCFFRQHRPAWRGDGRPLFAV